LQFLDLAIDFAASIRMVSSHAGSHFVCSLQSISVALSLCNCIAGYQRISGLHFPSALRFRAFSVSLSLMVAFPPHLQLAFWLHLSLRSRLRSIACFFGCDSFAFNNELQCILYFRRRLAISSFEFGLQRLPTLRFSICQYCCPRMVYFRSEACVQYSVFDGDSFDFVTACAASIPTVFFACRSYGPYRNLPNSWSALRSI
jgi:hypothetical protein